LIIEGIREGLSGPEIREALRLSQTDYDTAMKRMRRMVRAMVDAEEANA
jgi:hypothetical protein